MVPRAANAVPALMTRLTSALGGLFRPAPSHPTAPFASHMAAAGAHPHSVAPGPGFSHAPAPRKDADRDPRREDDALDPLARHAAQLAPPSILAPPSPAQLAPTPDPGGAPALRAMTSLEEILPIVNSVTGEEASLEEILPQLVRRLSMTGDGKRGAIRVEIGSGALAGSTLLVSAEEGRLRVELSLPASVDATAWRDRIATRLSARGLTVDEVSVQNA